MTFKKTPADVTKSSFKIPQDWFSSAYARKYFDSEEQHIKSAIKQAIGPKVLQVGSLIDQQLVDDFDLPYLVRSTGVERETADLIADPAFLPLASDSFSTVLLPHVLEGNRLPHQVLREAHRVLMHEGYLVLTGFNPMSLIGLQNWVYRRAVFNGRYYTSRRVIDWLQLLGFDVVASSMYQYSPLSSNQRVNKIFNFLESVGDRWLPMMGGGYMITAKKRDLQMTMVGKKASRRQKRAFARGAASIKCPTHQQSKE